MFAASYLAGKPELAWHSSLQCISFLLFKKFLMIYLTLKRRKFSNYGRNSCKQRKVDEIWDNLFLKPRRDYQCELIRTQDTYDLLVNELEGYLGNRSLEHLQAVSFKAMCVKRIVYFYAWNTKYGSIWDTAMVKAQHCLRPAYYKPNLTPARPVFNYFLDKSYNRYFSQSVFLAYSCCLMFRHIKNYQKTLKLD